MLQQEPRAPRDGPLHSSDDRPGRGFSRRIDCTDDDGQTGPPAPVRRKRGTRKRRRADDAESDEQGG